GNEYYLFVYEVYTDVRLVGAPPSSIGKFGGDTDNWMWPRHTGDFSIFRVYTAPDGSPAEYAKENVPLKPKYHLPVSINGVEKGDFAMIWGYPGQTDRYLCSYGVDFQIRYFDPNIVRLLGEQLSIWKEDMNADREIGIKYASKYASAANGWKFYIGELKGLKKLDVKGQKEEIEARFTQWVNQDQARKDKYGNVLSNLESGYATIGSKFEPFILAALGANSPEILGFAQTFGQLAGLMESKDKTGAIDESVKELRESAAEHFKDYSTSTDQKVFARMMEIYSKEMPVENQPESFREMVEQYKGDFQALAADVFEESVFSTLEKTNAFLDKPSFKVISKDPAYKLSGDFMGVMMNMAGEYKTANQEIGKNERLFMAGLREMMPEKAFYPDANSTMRLTYGSVQDYKGADAVYYDYKTHLSGVMDKEDPTNEEFIVPEKLKELYAKKDFGRYGNGDDLVVGFLTTNDITGGNSGSPVINGNGELIGLAFDGNWEAMSGNIAYEPKLQRTICVDIRYVLFVIDKYAGAQNLIDELTFAPVKIKIPREVSALEPVEVK
ncbi:MAG: S46 family peptidase, partial [Bacteroidales bacterium]|nr:S46 family peptidase [Bacteroidales bacterium]